MCETIIERAMSEKKLALLQAKNSPIMGTRKRDVENGK